jgi:ElaB/YqjD/DUF883 family membrane-anchored ribosome-binding protein
VERSEREIEATRSAITEDLRALGEKLTPEHIKEEAAGMAKAAVGAAREAVSDRVERVEDSLRRVSSQTREVAHQQVERAKRNPFALAGVGLLAGLGIGLLFPVTQAEDRALAGPSRAIREQARGTFAAGRDTARRLRSGVEDAAREVKDAWQEGTQTT